MIEPKEVTGLDMAFGPKRISDLLPPFSAIPKEFDDYSNPWAKVVSRWFHSGLKEVPQAKAGIEGKKALSHVAAIMRSFEPKHEHKIAGCAYLMSLWFELPKERP